MSLSNKKFTQTEIGLIPDDWQVTITKKCLSIPITDGPHETPILYEDGIPFISAESVSSGNGRIDFSRMRGYISEEYHQECCKKYKPQKNDVYIIKSGSTTGKVAIVKTDQVFNIWSPLAVLRAKQDIVPDYLFYAVQSSYYQEQIIQAWGMGTQQNIGMRTLEHLKVAYPEYDEQHAIATTLSDMDALIEAKTALLEKKRAIKQGALLELLTGRRRLPGFAVTPMKQTDIGEIPEDWEIRHLGKVGSFFKGAGISKADLVGGGEPCIRYAELYTTYGNTCAVATPKSKADPDKVKVKANYGDIIFAGSGETFEDIGRALAYVGSEPIAVGGDTIIYTNHDFEPRFLGYVLNSPAIVRQKMTLATGTTIIHIHDKQLRMLITPHPDYEEQIAIADSLSEMELELDSLTTEITKLRDIKQGMMQELLTGRIRLVK